MVANVPERSIAAANLRSSKFVCWVIICFQVEIG